MIMNASLNKNLFPVWINQRFQHMNCKNANGVNIDCDFAGDCIQVHTFYFCTHNKYFNWLSARIRIERPIKRLVKTTTVYYFWRINGGLLSVEFLLIFIFVSEPQKMYAWNWKPNFISYFIATTPKISIFSNISTHIGQYGRWNKCTGSINALWEVSFNTWQRKNL